MRIATVSTTAPLAVREKGATSDTPVSHLAAGAPASYTVGDQVLIETGADVDRLVILIDRFA